jgi:hypothetical protein
VTCTHPARTSGEVRTGPPAEVKVPEIVASVAAVDGADDVVEAAVSDPNVQAAVMARTSSPGTTADAFTITSSTFRIDGRDEGGERTRP